MARLFVVVRVDLEQLRANLEAADREPKSLADARQFLIDSGFRETPDGWVVSEADLGVLQPDEVTSVEPLPEP